MSQKDSKFDEFASLFRSALRPHLEIEPLPLRRLLVVVDLDGDPDKLAGLEGLTRSMLDHFKPALKLFAPINLEQKQGDAEQRLSEMCERLRSKDLEVEFETKECFPAQAILEQRESFGSDFLVMPSLFGERDPSFEGCTLGAVVDKVLCSTSIPLLLVEGGVPEPELLWQNILIFVEEVDSAEPCIAATRTLAGKAAQARMLHVIDEHMLFLVRRAFELATEMETEVATKALVDALKKDMEHYLQGAKELLDRTGHQSSFQVEVGDPVEVTRQFIRRHDPRLVICNSLAPNQRLVDSVAYNLAAYLRESPLLLV